MSTKLQRINVDISDKRNFKMLNKKMFLSN